VKTNIKSSWQVIQADGGTSIYLVTTKGNNFVNNVKEQLFIKEGR
jgi:hypothetical protein